MQVVTMVLVFCLSWGPYALLSLIGILGYSEVSTHTIVLDEAMNYRWFRWSPCM